MALFQAHMVQIVNRSALLDCAILGFSARLAFSAEGIARTERAKPEIHDEDFARERRRRGRAISMAP